MANNIKIGNDTVIDTFSLIIPNDVTTSIPITVEEWSFNLNIIFPSEELEDSEAVVQFDEVDGNALLKFYNWNNTLGTTFLIPMELGKTESGRVISVAVYHWKKGKINKLDMQLLLGDDE